MGCSINSTVYPELHPRGHEDLYSFALASELYNFNGRGRQQKNHKALKCQRSVCKGRQTRSINLCRLPKNQKNVRRPLSQRGERARCTFTKPTGRNDDINPTCEKMTPYNQCGCFLGASQASIAFERRCCRESSVRLLRKSEAGDDSAAGTAPAVARPRAI